MSNKIELFQDISVVSLNMKEWEDFFQYGTKIKRPKGYELFKSGEIWNKLYVLVQGEAKLVRVSANGKEKIFWSGVAPCLLGEGPFFDEMPSLSSFILTQDSILYCFTYDVVHSILLNNKNIALSIIKNLALKARIVNNFNSCMCFTELSTRICLFLHQTLRSDNNKKQFYAVPEFTQQELANHLGVHRVTINKTLRYLEQQGIIGPYNKKITYILDIETFTKIINKNI